ncbi:MAG: pre-peptidase C-terminal domain-containing protein, partial [Chloroflexota bacterium]
IEFSEASTLRVVEFDGFAGDVITISVDSGGEFDTVATLIAPSGEEIASDDDGGFGVDPEIERIVLPETGTYTLEIRPFTVGDSGSAVVTISRNTVQTLDDTRLITLDSKTTSDILTVEAEAGENLTLVVGLVEGEVGQLVITAEQGDITLMNYQAFGLPETLNLGFVVPESGVVVIRIESDGSTVATLNAQIER